MKGIITIVGEPTVYATRKNTENDDKKVKLSISMDAIPAYFAECLLPIIFRISARYIRRRMAIIPVSVH